MPDSGKSSAVGRKGPALERKIRIAQRAGDDSASGVAVRGPSWPAIVAEIIIREISQIAAVGPNYIDVTLLTS